MRLLNMRIQARQEAMDRLEAIQNRAADEEGRELNEGEQAEVTQLRSQIDTLDTQIEEMEADAERKAKTHTRAVETPPARDGAEGAGSGDGKGNVQVRSEPGVYGDGPDGLRRFFVDLAVKQGIYQSTRSESTFARANERMTKHIEAATSAGADTMTRAVAMSDLAGIVNPQFDAARVSRGIYDVGVTTRLLNRYPIWAEGDSLTLPRVTTEADAAVQTEGSDHTETQIATAAVKADLFTVSARAEISVQAIERGNMSLELLSDEMNKAWMQRLNRIVLLAAPSAGNNTPAGLLHSSRASAHGIQRTDASPTAQKMLDYLSDIKSTVWGVDRRRVDCYVVNHEQIARWEKLQQNGQYVIPPWPMWAYNVGGAGTLPEMEGPMSDMEWRRVPVYVDPTIPDTFTTAHAATGGDQTRMLGLVSDEVPIFYNGAMTYTYDQTLAASGQVLIVVRGYAAFNPEWRPEAWRYVFGTGVKVS